MKNKAFWITLSIVNLCVVGFLGFLLRTKFLFPIPFIDYKNLLSAHSHFAFGGWVTLILMVLMIEHFLESFQKKKRIYQFILWGIQLCSVGMLVTFPFEGYGPVAIFFSTLFILFTYIFTWIFLKDVRPLLIEKLVLLSVNCALISLVASSAGPFWLAYMMATHTGNATAFRDATYIFLHFQYNGFFTLTVFSLFFKGWVGTRDPVTRKKVSRFSVVLCLSVIPSLFLSLLWHFYNPVIRALSFLGGFLLLASLVFFLALFKGKIRFFAFDSRLGNNLLKLSMFSFVIKTVLQTGTIIPELGHAVFGYRPIIIGFLHLVFLGLVTFYILSVLIESKHISIKPPSRNAVIYFSAAIIINELILLVNGMGLLFKITHPIYGWLLWIASILLFTGTIWLVITRVGLFKKIS